MALQIKKIAPTVILTALAVLLVSVSTSVSYNVQGSVLLLSS